MEKSLSIIYFVLYVVLLCCRVTKQEEYNDEQLMQIKGEPYTIFKYFHIIDVPKKPCPKDQRRDIFGNCRPIFNFATEEEVGDDDQLMQKLLIKAYDVLNLLHVIDVPKKNPCLDNQKKDIFEECRPTSNFDFVPKQDNDVERFKQDKEEPIKPPIMGIPIRPCPENQKRDIFGECRPKSNFDLPQEDKDVEQFKGYKPEPMAPYFMDTPIRPCLGNQKRDIFGECRQMSYFDLPQEESDDERLKQDKQKPTKPPIMSKTIPPIKPCPENQKRNIFGECRPKSNFVINQEGDNSEELIEVNEKPIKRHEGFNLFHIINVPIKSCPENQRRDIFGNCRAVFN